MKRKSHFHFKHFSLNDDRCSMKVGTDAVLLGAWFDITNARRILDIGAGSGLIALMAGQRTNSNITIDAVEIEVQDAGQASENVANSPWAAKIVVHQGDIRQFKTTEGYDIIVSNPPFFINSLPPPDRRRQVARHTTSLDYDTLISNAKRLLKQDGKFNVILPSTEGLLFLQDARRHGMHCSRQYGFRTRTDKPVERWLLEVGQAESKVDTGDIVLYENGQRWSDHYRQLTSEFYLESQHAVAK